MKISALHSYVQPQFNIKCWGSKPVAYEAKIKRNHTSVFLEGLRQSNVSWDALIYFLDWTIYGHWGGGKIHPKKKKVLNFKNIFDYNVHIFTLWLRKQINKQTKKWTSPTISINFFPQGKTKQTNKNLTWFNFFLLESGVFPCQVFVLYMYKSEITNISVRRV